MRSVQEDREQMALPWERENDGHDRTLCMLLMTCGVSLFRSTRVSERLRVGCGESRAIADAIG